MNKVHSFLFKVAIILYVSIPAAEAQLATGSDKFFGAILKHGSAPDPDFKTYFNQVTPENSGKWGYVEAGRNVMNWAVLDFQYDYSMQNDFPFKQHTFIWDLAQPSWMNDLGHEEQRAEVEEWIRLFCERFSEVSMIEPVNEPTRNPAPYKEALGGAGDTGYDWVIWGFEKVRHYAPNATLILNDYDVLKFDDVRQELIQIAYLLKDRELIDAIGCQGHFLEGQSATQIKNALDELAATGLDIYITELDIHISNDQNQLNKYKEIFPVMWEHPAVKGITLWGYKEGSMWRDQGYLLRKDGSERPAMQWLKSYITSKTPNPFVEITGPDKSNLYWEGETLTLTAEAIDGDGTVTQVEFFNNGVSLGIITDGNYTLNLEDAQAGMYSFTAVATDSNGLSYESGIHAITVLSSDDIIPLEDSFVRSDNPITTYGVSDQGELNLRWTANDASIRYSYLKFQIPDYDENTIITKANLQLFGYNYNSSNPIQLEFLLAENTWNEELVTWNNKPSFIENTPVLTVDYPFLNATSGGIEVDISPLLESITEKTFTVALRIKSFVEGGGLIKFASKENTSGHPIPKLSIDTSTGNVEVNQLMYPQVKVYPNPVAHGPLTIESENPLSEVILYGVKGNILLKKTGNNESRIKMDVSKFQPGVYIIQSRDISGVLSINRLIIR